jgi:hypothetical protein
MVFDELFGGGAGLGGDLFEGVEVDADEVDGGDGVLLEGFEVLGFGAHGENAAVDGRVEGFDAAVEHFGEVGDGGDVEDGDAGVLEEFGGAAGGDEVDVEGAESAGELDGAGFVGQAQEGPFNLCHEPLLSHRVVRLHWKKPRREGDLSILNSRSILTGAPRGRLITVSPSCLL